MSENGLSENAKVEIRRLMAQFPHLQSAECLAACEAAPAVMVGTERFGLVTPESIGEILSRYRSAGPEARSPVVQQSPKPEAQQSSSGEPVLLKYLHEPDQGELEAY